MTTVVVGLIAMMVHQASLSPPGGLWQDDTPSHKTGKAVVASTHPGLYKLFYRSNNTAIISSLLVILLITISAPKTSFIYTVVILLATIVALGAVSLCYGTAMFITNPAETQYVSQVIATVGAGFMDILLLTLAMAALKNLYAQWKEHKV